MKRINKDEWHEFDMKQALELPPGLHKQIKLYVDANIPRKIIEELRGAGLDIKSVIEEGYAFHPDENIYQQAKRFKRVILTMDRDFWNDKKHSLQKSPGVIFVDLPPDQPDKAIDGLARFYALFAQYYPLDYWQETKAKVSEYSFVIRLRTFSGKVSEDEFCLTKIDKLLTRRLR